MRASARQKRRARPEPEEKISPEGGAAAARDPFVVTPFATSKSEIPQRPLMESGHILTHPHSWMFCGATGMGKTQLVLHLLTHPQLYGPGGERYDGTPAATSYFDEVFLYSETAEAGDDLYQKHLRGVIPEDHVFAPNAKGLAQLRHTIEVQKQKIKEADGDHTKVPKLLFLFDDVAHAYKFLNSDEYLLLHIANRHLNASCWTLTQSYVKPPRSARIQVKGVCYFFGGTNTEKVRLASEHTPANCTVEQMMEIIDYAAGKKYDFLFINKLAKDSRDIYRHTLKNILRLHG